MESIGQQLQRDTEEGDKSIDETLDQLIKTLKEVASSYESFGKSNKKI